MYKKTATILLFILLLVLLSGCVFFKVPKDVAETAKLERISWIRNNDLEDFNNFGKIQDSVYGLESVTDLNTKEYEDANDIYDCIDVFLHISDVHIRDEKIHESSPLRKLQLQQVDWVEEVTLRSPCVELYDSIVFTSFLVGSAKDSNASFIVHTGDLLDISLSTELVEAMNIMRIFTQKYPDLPIYSLAGNHDGLIWGNLPDRYTKTRGLGINRTEFVLGNMLADPNYFRGFGFSGNEVLKKYKFKEDVDTLKNIIGEKKKEKWWKLVCKQLEDIIDAAEERSKIYTSEDPKSLLCIPINFRNAIHTADEGDRDGLKCGYYSWLGKKKNSSQLNGIRYIALDTRDNQFASGDMDDIQLGWLYNTLIKSLDANEIVIIFAHHPPDDIESYAFHNMLQKFSNIAAYFYGHVHPTENYDQRMYPVNCREKHCEKCYEEFLLVQTPSIADFPQTAREVKVYQYSSSPDRIIVKFRWRHVRPKGYQKTHKDSHLYTLLDTSLRESKKDYNKWSLLKRNRKPIELSYQEWADKNLKSDAEIIKVTFTKRPGPSEIFNKNHLEKINQIRCYLDLPEVK
jgi:hypothetical protein